MNPIIEINDETLAALIVADMEEQSKPIAFAQKIAKATELIDRVGLPNIEQPENAITFEDFKMALLQLGFREETNAEFICFKHDETETIIKLALPNQDAWLPAGWLRLKSKSLFEKGLIQTEDGLSEIIEHNRLIIEA